MKTKWVWLCTILGILVFAQPQTHARSAQVATFAFTVEKDVLTPKENVAPFHEILSPVTFIEKHETSMPITRLNWSVLTLLLLITSGGGLIIHQIWKKEARKDE